MRIGILQTLFICFAYPPSLMNIRRTIYSLHCCSYRDYNIKRTNGVFQGALWKRKTKHWHFYIQTLAWTDIRLF